MNAMRKHGVIAFMALGGLLSGCGATATAVKNQSNLLTEQAHKEYPAGIAVERVAMAASGLMLDLRYRIVDPQKAGAALGRSAKIYLRDQASGEILPVPAMPKVGKLRQLPMKGENDRIYWMFFQNSKRLVKQGGKVTLVINDLETRDIIVE